VKVRALPAKLLVLSLGVKAAGKEGAGEMLAFKGFGDMAAAGS
jgi:hypothetical protein